MSRLPSLNYKEVLRALQRDGWIIVRQRGSHIRLAKRRGDRLMKLTVPAHNPIKRSTLAVIIKQAGLELVDFLNLL